MIVLLIIVGLLIGMFFHWGMLAVTSFIVVVARVVYYFQSGQSVAVDLLMMAACLCALQGGYIVGGYIAYKKET